MSGAVTNKENTGTDAGRALFILWSLMAVPVGGGAIVLTKSMANCYGNIADDDTRVECW